MSPAMLGILILGALALWFLGGFVLRLVGLFDLRRGAVGVANGTTSGSSPPSEPLGGSRVFGILPSGIRNTRARSPVACFPGDRWRGSTRAEIGRCQSIAAAGGGRGDVLRLVPSFSVRQPEGGSHARSSRSRHDETGREDRAH